MSYEAALARYEKFEFTDGRWTRPVYKRGSGPAVIVIHEVPGLHPLVIRFADRVAEAGMTGASSTCGMPASRARLSNGRGRWPVKLMPNAAAATFAWADLLSLRDSEPGGPRRHLRQIYENAYFPLAITISVLGSFGKLPPGQIVDQGRY